MRIKKCILKFYIENNIDQSEDVLSRRINYIFRELIDSIPGEEIELFQLLIYLIFLCEDSPVEYITNLMTLLTKENSYLLDHNIISDSSSFIRDNRKLSKVLETFRCVG